MVVTYTTAAKVNTLMGLKSAFGAGTDPTTTEVESLINECEDEIDRYTGHAWRQRYSQTSSMSESSSPDYEYYDISGDYRHGVGIPIYLKHREIRTLASGTDKIEVFNGATYDEYISTKTEGRGSDYWLDYKKGVLYLVNAYPAFRIAGVRVKYKYGAPAVALDIEKACTLLAAAMVGESQDRTVVMTDNGDVMPLIDKLGSWRRQAYAILDRYREFSVIG